MYKRRIIYSIIFFLLLSVPQKTVEAQGTKIVTPLLYSIAQEQAYVDQALGATGAASLSPQQLLDIVFRAQAAGTLPSIGTAIASGKNYKASTGTSGAAAGQIPEGTYSLQVTPVEGVTMTLASRSITLDPANPTVVDIAMKLTKGAGRVVYRAGDSLWERVRLFVHNAWTSIVRLVKRTPQNPAPAAGGSTAFVVFRLYQDANNNGVYDQGEKIVPWANVSVLLTPTSQ